MKAIKRDDDKPCAAALWNAGEPSPRTCERCGLGPCPDGVVRRDGPGVEALPPDDPEAQAMARLDAPGCELCGDQPARKGRRGKDGR